MGWEGHGGFRKEHGQQVGLKLRGGRMGVLRGWRGDCGHLHLPVQGAFRVGMKKANTIRVGRDPNGGPVQLPLVLFTIPQGLILEFYGSIFVTVFGGVGWEPGVPQILQCTGWFRLLKKFSQTFTCLPGHSCR